MDMKLLAKHIEHYRKFTQAEAATYIDEVREREERKAYFTAWTSVRLRDMNAEAFGEFLANLWAMRIWGNKAYKTNKLIDENSLPKLTEALDRLMWGKDPVAKRWDWVRANISGMGPAMISEILCHTHPGTCMLWNRRAYAGLRYLGVPELPRYDYQMTGDRYVKLSASAQLIGAELIKAGFEGTDLLAVDYFIWRELQVDDNLSQMHKKPAEPASTAVVQADAGDTKISQFLHNDVRDKVADIGAWLGFNANKEVSVSAGSKVDAVWEATIGNLGRVIYVFEVQTKGSIDSLIINLLKSLKNPAVQGVVAVSDKAQIEKIKAHSRDVTGLHGKLKFWDYEEVLQVHEALSSVNEAINRLGLVPESF